MNIPQPPQSPLLFQNPLLPFHFFNVPIPSFCHSIVPSPFSFPPFQCLFESFQPPYPSQCPPSTILISPSSILPFRHSKVPSPPFHSGAYICVLIGSQVIAPHSVAHKPLLRGKSVQELPCVYSNDTWPGEDKQYHSPEIDSFSCFSLYEYTHFLLPIPSPSF